MTIMMMATMTNPEASMTSKDNPTQMAQRIVAALGGHKLIKATQAHGMHVKDHRLEFDLPNSPKGVAKVSVGTYGPRFPGEYHFRFFGKNGYMLAEANEVPEYELLRTFTEHTGLTVGA